MRLRIALLALAVLAQSRARPASAQSAGDAAGWPTKPIHVISPFGAGSAIDVVPRIIFEDLSKRLGQPIVVEPRPGAGGTIGTGMVVRAEPDGYTVLLNSSAHTVAPLVYSNLGYDPVRDLAAIVPLGNLPNVMIVPPQRGWRTAQDFVAYAKAHPSTINFGSTGVGAATHMSAERFRLSAGFQAAHVPFKSGSEALTEIVAGRIDYYFCPIGTALPFIADRRVTALVVSPPKRAAALPDVPTTLEAGYAASDYTFWMGLFAPAKTPHAVIEKFARETAAAMAEPGVKARLAQNGVEPLEMSPGAFDQFVAKELAENVALVKAIGLKGN